MRMWIALHLTLKLHICTFLPMRSESSFAFLEDCLSARSLPLRHSTVLVLSSPSIFLSLRKKPQITLGTQVYTERETETETESSTRNPPPFPFFLTISHHHLLFHWPFTAEKLSVLSQRHSNKENRTSPATRVPDYKV